MKKLIVSTAICAALYMPASQAALSGEVDKMFTGLTSYTPPQAFSSQERGYLTGGNFTYRDKVVGSPQILSFTPPSIDAGCSGATLFGGALSMISGDKIVEWARAVGSNAVGYFFQLALESACPTCNTIMSRLQKWMQDLNGKFSDSCTAAKGLLNIMGVNSKSMKAALSDNAFEKGAKALDNDLLSFFSQNTTKEQASATEFEKLKGNIVIQSLDKFGNRFNGGGSGPAMDELIMSITGTIIYHDCASRADDICTTPIAPTIPADTIKDILVGSTSGTPTTFEYLNCADAACLTPVKTTVNDFNGLVERLIEILGADTNPQPGSLFYELGQSSGANISSDVMYLVENTEAPIYLAIKKMYRASPSLARAYAKENAKYIATRTVRNTMKKVLMTASSDAYTSETTDYHTQLGEFKTRVLEAQEIINKSLSEDLELSTAALKKYNDHFEMLKNVDADLYYRNRKAAKSSLTRITN